MLKFIDYLQGVLTDNVTTMTVELPVNPAFVDRLVKNMVNGQHIYLTLHRYDNYEIVKYVHDDNAHTRRTILVQRDAEEKGRLNFPCHTKITADWNSLQMRDFIAEVSK